MSRMHAIVDAAAHLAPSVAPRPAREPRTADGAGSRHGAPRSYVTHASPSLFRIA